MKIIYEFFILSFGSAGVIRQGQGQSAYGHHRRDTVVAINLTSNRAAVAIGQLARSSSDLYMCGGVGVCVNTLHVFGDKLWNLEDSLCLQIPLLGPLTAVPKLESDFPTLGAAGTSVKPVPAPVVPAPVVVKYQPPKEHFPALGGEPKRPPHTAQTQSTDVQSAAIKLDGLAVQQSLDSTDDEDDSSDDGNEPPSSAVAADFSTTAAVATTTADSDDDVLRRAFFTTLKLDGRKLVLPMLTSTFYRCHVVPAAERPIELKRTPYKKLGKFLAEMAEARYITLREEQKGIEKIVAVNLEHPDLVEFVAQAKRPSGDGGSNVDAMNGLFVTEMKELYLVTDATAKFWARFNLANGQGAEKAQLKRMLKEYVCNNKLQSAQHSQVIVCNELLASLLGGFAGAGVGASIEFDVLFAAIIGQMKVNFEMRQLNEVRSSKNPTIQMQLATRSGNKKVTLVNNLEAFGIRLAEFEKACKIGVAASTTVTKLANQKGEQLLVQGNQIKFIHKLLTETYKIPAKNIVGSELAKKEKKSASKKK